MKKLVGLTVERRADVLRKEHADLVTLFVYITSRYAVAYAEPIQDAA